MGVFKWLRRERITITSTQNASSAPSTPVAEPSTVLNNSGTIRTEEYKRDLAEFQARRSSGQNDIIETPKKSKCGTHSLIACTNCTSDGADNTFNYEKKSAQKYKKKKLQRHSLPEETAPNIQFLFQNQVFMPGNIFTHSYSEPQRYKRQVRRISTCSHHSQELRLPLPQRQLHFDEENDQSPLIFKNNALPFNLNEFLDRTKSDEELDGSKAAGDINQGVIYSPTSSDKNDSCEDKLLEELKIFDQWADEQLKLQSLNSSKSEKIVNETSICGLPVLASSDIDVSIDKYTQWNMGHWGMIPVQVKKLNGTTMEHVKQKKSCEINILRKCRHPNIILLMGLYPDFNSTVNLICERCIDTLYNILHIQGQILSAQTAVKYVADIASALVFLQMQGFIHTELNSTAIMITHHDTAKLADLSACVPFPVSKPKANKHFDLYTIEPQYVNIEEARSSEAAVDCQPLISASTSDTYLANNAISKEYTMCQNSEYFQWHAPELFEPDENRTVQLCSKSVVYSLSMILWENCNASKPWKTLSYKKLKERYVVWKIGMDLPQDGTYPGCLLEILQKGLQLERPLRMDIKTFAERLQIVKQNIDELEYILIPARLSKKISNFSSVAWNNSPSDSDLSSPTNDEKQKIILHYNKCSSTDASEKESPVSSDTKHVGVIVKKKNEIYTLPERCYVDDVDSTDGDVPDIAPYQMLYDKNISSNCSTPIRKVKSKLKDIGTPGANLQKSDSTEYNSICTPGNTIIDYDSPKYTTVTTKLSKSFTPKSYKPLHIKVPDFKNLESIKALPKYQNRTGNRASTYNFEVRNYSLPSTPIARSNKLRKNAWLSGDIKNIPVADDKKEEKEHVKSAPETPVLSASAGDKDLNVTDICSSKHYVPDSLNSETAETDHDSSAELHKTDPQQDLTSSALDSTFDNHERSHCWSTSDRTNSLKSKMEDEVLANVNVKPLVAIHERWIYEANKKTGRSASLPEENKFPTLAVKPASHCVDTLQKSLPQLNTKRYQSDKYYKNYKSSSPSGGFQSQQFCKARDFISKSMNFSFKDPHHEPSKKANKCTNTTHSDYQTKLFKDEFVGDCKVDQSTDTTTIEEFIKELIRKEFEHLIQEISFDETTSKSKKNEAIVNRGTANVLEALKSTDDSSESQYSSKSNNRSFSKVKINGNNKPLLQIIFSRSGENSLQVLDDCVNVTIRDSKAKLDGMNSTTEETVEELQNNSLRRCQGFNALQEARSTEDLYIDDDLSTHMEENFGGKVKLIPLHGSLHEILCEKEDDCCLIKVKQENGCDTIYFKCDNSDTESKDALDCVTNETLTQDTVVFKRSFSLIEERIVYPKEKQKHKTPQKEGIVKPKSAVSLQNKPLVVLSKSNPSLVSKPEKPREVELNIENVMSYQDSSSDECIKCQAENDDFEMIERKIEEDVANGILPKLVCGCLDKISEENLSASDDCSDRERCNSTSSW